METNLPLLFSAAPVARSLFGLLVGFGGGAWHLWVLSYRARRLDAAGLALAPVGLMGPLAAVVLVAMVDRTAVWAVVPGLLLARLVLLPRIWRRLGAGP